MSHNCLEPASSNFAARHISAFQKKTFGVIWGPPGFRGLLNRIPIFEGFLGGRKGVSDIWVWFHLCFCFFWGGRVVGVSGGKGEMAHDPEINHPLLVVSFKGIPSGSFPLIFY